MFVRSYVAKISWSIFFVCACETMLFTFPIVTAISVPTERQHDAVSVDVQGLVVERTTSRKQLANEHMGQPPAVQQHDDVQLVAARAQLAQRTHEQELARQMQSREAAAPSASPASAHRPLFAMTALSGAAAILAAMMVGTPVARAEATGEDHERRGRTHRSSPHLSRSSSPSPHSPSPMSTMSGEAPRALGYGAVGALSAVGLAALSRPWLAARVAQRYSTRSLSTAAHQAQKRSVPRGPAPPAHTPASSVILPTAASATPSVSGAGVHPATMGTPTFEHLASAPAATATATAASPATMSDAELLAMLADGRLQQHSLEKVLQQAGAQDAHERAVRLRRLFFGAQLGVSMDALPHENYAYERVVGACCENVLGYVPLPIGLAGPVLLDGSMVALPMATVEGCLVASTHRGAKAITVSGGAISSVVRDGMTRAPALRFASLREAAAFSEWLGHAENVQRLRDAFESTSRFAKLVEVSPTLAGRTVYLRFRSTTGDAMGMNMISKGVERALEEVKAEFEGVEVLSLSGNMCTDKKPSAINWIEGRGKSVVVEAVITGDVVRDVLKTTVAAMVDLNTQKNLIGSAMAGSIGGFNAHASNIVTAMFLATGQDAAQNVESSNCITLMEPANEGVDLRISCTMPSIEVGTVGGGTHLPAQSACLDMLHVRGAHPEKPGENARQLARVVAVGVMAGELSLMAALSAGHLVRSHMQHNRKKE